MPPKRNAAQQLAAFHRDIERTLDGRAADVSERIVGEMTAESNRYGRRVTASGVRTVSAQVEQGLLGLYTRMISRSAGVMVDEMGGLVHEATADANMRLARVFKNVEGAVPAALHESTKTQARRAMRAQVMNQIAQQDMHAGWGPNMHAAVATTLAHARQNGLPVQEAVANIDRSVRDLQWQIDMAAQTHAAAAYNGAQNDTLRVIASTVPQLYKRWTELIDDHTGQPFDKRVANDSFVLHGQVAHTEALFVMPPDPRVSAKLHGKTWPHPPNRPRDRAVLVPWRPGWGVPAWEWRGGARVDL